MIYSFSVSSSVKVTLPFPFLTTLTPSSGFITFNTLITSSLPIPVRSYSPSSPLKSSSPSHISSLAVSSSVSSLPSAPATSSVSVSVSTVSESVSSGFSTSPSVISSVSVFTSSSSKSSLASEIMLRSCLLILSSTMFCRVFFVVSSSFCVNLSLSSTRFLIYSLLILFAIMTKFIQLF